MRLADYTIDFLANRGIKNIFMVTGRGILFLTDAVAKNNDIKSFSLHHEQSCAFASISDSIINNNTGCCLVSTGCGATNAITGVLNAYQDMLPLIFISGNNPLNETTVFNKTGIRTYGSQELDIVSIVKPITKYAVMITNPNDIAYELEKAYYIANEGDKGPVWIDIPLDIQNARVEVEDLHYFNEVIENRIELDEKGANEIISEIEKSSRPIFIIGSGLKNANAVDGFVKLVDNTNIPFVYTPSAVDSVDGTNDLNIGCVSSLGGSREGNFAVQNSDLMIVLGSRMSSMITGGIYDKFGKYAKKIIVNWNKDECKKNNIKFDYVLNADVKDFINYTLQKINYTADKKWIDKCVHWKETLTLCNSKYADNEKIDLYSLAGVLSKRIDSNTCVVTDAGFEELILPSNVKFVKGSRCIHPASQGSMGFALPASIGVAVNGNKNVVCIVGDGSIMMNLQELQSIVSNNLKVKILIINNNNYAVIRKRQKDIFRNRIIGTDDTNGVTTPDWKSVADCFNFDYIQINNSSELFDKLDYIFNADDKIICEIICDENQKYLHTSIMKTEDNKFLRRPMEDQSPFLDRELIKSELLIPYEE